MLGGDCIRKKKKNKIYFSINKLFPIFIFIVTVLMSIGYASINSIFLEIGGEITAKESSGIFITKVNYLSNVDAVGVIDLTAAFDPNFDDGIMENIPSKKWYDINISYFV